MRQGGTAIASFFSNPLSLFFLRLFWGWEVGELVGAPMEEDDDWRSLTAASDTMPLKPNDTESLSS
jgi:hypothetical protein